MQLNPHIRLTLDFTVDKEGKYFCAEASSLGFRAGMEPFGPLYDDAADVGITLDNPETGNRTHWYMEEEELKEGELQAWRFRPTHETLRAHPRLEGWKLTVFND